MSGKRSGAVVRASAARAVDAVVAKGRSLDVALAEQESSVAAVDIALLRMLGFGVLRHYFSLRSELSHFISKPLRDRDSVIEALLLVGLLQLRELMLESEIGSDLDGQRGLVTSRFAGQ